MPKFSYDKPAKKRKTFRDDDRKFYNQIWEDRPHFCEECGVNLDKYVKENGDPISHLFSHRHSKGARQDLRLDPNNINLLCPECHRKWEFGNRKSMDIYFGFDL